MTKELNIKSTTIEKGLELIKDFATKLVGPTIDEVGLLMSDKIRYFRFKNQIKILVKAEEYVKRENIKIKEIPTKILVPLLENASLEEDEELQKKWSFMIGNLADSDQNLQNQIFPYILTQISINEYERLYEFCEKERAYMIDHIKLLDIRKEKGYANPEYSNLSKRVNKVQQEGFHVEGLEEYEFSNLQRLGLLRQLPPRIIIDEFKTEYNDYGGEEWHQIEAEYDPDDYGYRITSLGIKFVSVCEEKKENDY
ncbi:Abi-alpha family protein [uncultured Aquimarina sp.]|uniref:Abi-alpha family protein n=1 Tax=uncultured Aquimarina sp. TaxID=575652 RepID=UPI00261DEE36|nr:Abi-alpha family protein [uncultured Aquimarina sp.]